MPIDELSATAFQIKMLFKNGDQSPLHIASGTGFFWRKNNEIYLITNKHNLSGKNIETGQLISPTGAKPNMIEISYYPSDGILKTSQHRLYSGNNQIEESNRLWTTNNNENQDVACLSITRSELSPEQELYCANDYIMDSPPKLKVSQSVFVLGYPVGINIQGTPIWKKATIASEPEFRAHRGQPTILIDTATKSGMSGAPVYIFSSDPYTDNRGSLVISGEQIRHFIGVYSGRLGDNALEAQLGMVWTQDVIESIL